VAGLVLVNAGFELNTADSTKAATNAEPHGGGGAVRVDGIGALRVSSCAFTSNAARNFQWGTGGGAIWSRNTPLNVSGSTFVNNTAAGTGGGAIYAYMSGHPRAVPPPVVMTANAFLSNRIWCAVPPACSCNAANTGPWKVCWKVCGEQKSDQYSVYNAPRCSGGAIAVNYFGPAAAGIGISGAQLDMRGNNFTRCAASPFEDGASAAKQPQLMTTRQSSFGRGGAISVSLFPQGADMPTGAPPVTSMNFQLLANRFEHCSAVIGGAMSIKAFQRTALLDSKFDVSANTFHANVANSTLTPGLRTWFEQCGKGAHGGTNQAYGGAVSIDLWYDVARLSLAIVGNEVIDNIALADSAFGNAVLAKHGFDPIISTSRGAGIDFQSQHSLQNCSILVSGNTFRSNEQLVVNGPLATSVAPRILSANSGGGGGLSLTLSKIGWLQTGPSACECTTLGNSVQFENNAFESNRADGSGAGVRVFVGKPWPMGGCKSLVVACNASNNSVAFSSDVWSMNRSPSADSKGGGLALVLGRDTPLGTAGSDNGFRKFSYSWTATLANTTFIGNDANCDANSNGECTGQGRGGAVAVENGNTSIVGADFCENSAGWSGGAVAALQGSGAMALDGGSTFSDNAAATGSAFSSGGAAGSLGFRNVSVQMGRGSWGVFVSRAGNISYTPAAVLGCAPGSKARMGGNPGTPSTADSSCADEANVAADITASTDFPESRFIVYCEACSLGQYSLVGGAVRGTGSGLRPVNPVCNQCPNGGDCTADGGIFTQPNFFGVVDRHEAACRGDGQVAPCVRFFSVRCHCVLLYTLTTTCLLTTATDTQRPPATCVCPSRTAVCTRILRQCCPPRERG
jgi:hypothetical protein